MKNLFTQIICLAVFTLGLNFNAVAQCTGSFNYPTLDPAAPSCPSAGPIIIETCNWGSDFVNVTGFVGGNTYRFTCTNGYYISISDLTATTFYASGTSPVNFTPATSGSYRIHYHVNAACGSSTACQTTTMELTAMAVPINPPAGALAGTYNIPSICGGFTTLKQAIDSLNANGVSGAVTINVNANFTAPAGGYDLGSVVLNASTNATNTLTFNGNGNTLTGYTGTSTYADVIFDVRGTDFVTINNFVFNDAAANLTTTTKMDCAIRGICFDTTDGCKNLTITNNIINFDNGTKAHVAGQYGINIQTALPTATSSTATVTPTSAAGQHENIVIQGNTISHVYSGIQVRGHTTAATGYNVNNVTIGGDNSAEGNTISFFGTQAPATYSSTSYGIYPYATSGNTTVKNNTVSTATTVGTTYGIYNHYCNTGISTTTNQIIDVSKNDVSINNTGTGTVYGIYCYGLTTQNLGAWSYVDSNNVHDMVTGGTGTFYGIYHRNDWNKKRTNGNTITNVSRTGASGTSYGIYTYGLNSNVLMADTLIQINNGNTIDSITQLTTSGTSTITMYMLYQYGNFQQQCENNIIRNANIAGTSTGTHSIYGIYNSGYLAAKNLTGNQISNLSNVTTGTTKRVVGIYHYLFNSSTYNLSPNLITLNRNNVSGINNSSSGTGTECGGFWIESSTDVEIRNNFISDITAPNAAFEDGVFGMRIEGYSSSYPYTARVYNNTVQLGFVSPLVSTGANFGCSGISVDNVNPTVVSLDLRNNIIRVNATPSGTGRVRALGIQHLPPANFLTTSNYNIYYAPNAANTFLVLDAIQGYNLTNDPNFNTACGIYKSNHPNEFASFTENNMVAGTLPNTFVPIGASLAESGAQPLASVTVDYDNVARGTTPDIGALEFSGISAGDIVPPSISYTDLLDKVCLDNPILSATITDLSGVSVAAGTAPRIYYKKANEANALVGNTSANNGWKWTASTSTSSPFSFNLDYSLLSSPVIAGDTIEYFIVAQDSAITPNVATSSATYNTGFCPATVNLYVPTGATPITGTKSFTVIPVPSVTATASLSLICNTGDVDLGSSLMGSLVDPNISWQWQKSPTGSATWSNLTSPNTENFTVIGQSASTDYQLLVSCPSPQGLIATSSLVSVLNLTPVIDSVKNDTVCGTGTASLIAYVDTASYTVNWYDAPTGGSNLASGFTYNIGGLTATDTFYAEPNAGVGKVLITEITGCDACATGNKGTWLPAASLEDPVELTNTGTSPIDISGWKLEQTVSCTGSLIFPSGSVIAPGGTFVIQRGDIYTGPDIPGVFMSTLALGNNCAQSSSSIGLILSDATGTVQDVVGYNNAAVIGTGTPAAPIGSWAGTMASTSGSNGIRRVVVSDNDNASDWEISNPTSLTDYGTVNVSFTPTGCAGPRVAVIANFTPATPITASNDTTVCPDGSVMVPITVSSANTAYIYTWSPAAGLNTTTGDTVMANPLTPTQYIVTGDDGLCQSTDTVNVMVHAPFYDTASASLSVICAGGSVNLIAGDSVPPLPPYCASSATFIGDTKIDTVSFAGVTTGSPAVNEDYTDNTAIVIPVTAGTSYPLSVVNGDIAPTYYGPNQLYVYIDYNQDLTFDASELVYQTLATATAPGSLAPTNITIPLTALNGLTRMRVIVHEEASYTQQPCGNYSYGETEDYTVNISGGVSIPPPTYTYSWMPGSLSGASQTVTPTATTTYVATQTNGLGCTAQDSVVVTVNQPLIAATPASQTICAGGTTPASIEATGATTYTWTPTSTLTLNATNDSAMALPTSTTTYSVSGVDINGCIGTAMATVVVEALPVKDSVTATPGAVCTNGTSMLHAHFVYPKAAASYCSSNATNSADTKIDTVKFAGVITGSSPTNPETYTNNTSVVIPAAAGVPLPLQIINGSESLTHYGARVKVWIDYNQNNVFDAAEMVYEFGQTTALNTIPATTVTIPTTALNGPTRMRVVFRESGSTTSTVACGTYTYGETEDYTVNITGASAPITYTYAWTPSASVVSPTSAATATNAIANTTTFTVTATSSGAGCSATDSVTVLVTPLSAVQTTANKHTLCAGDSSQLDVLVSGGGLPYSYSWSPNTGMASGADTTQNPWVTPATTTTYTVTVTDACATTRTSVVTITVNPLPALTASASDSTLCFGDSSILTAVGTGSTFPTTVTLNPSKDNTIYEETPTNSNGAGPNFVAGQNGVGLNGRALMAFDLSSIPAGAVITSASLQLNCSQNPNTTPQPFMLHKASTNWGEGTSSATGAGAGVAATTNDATWLNAFTPAPAWGTPGGVFNATASATQTVIGQGLYTWSGAGMVADIQSWLAAPNTNNGWLLKGQETAASQARRFDSRENATAANRPSLTITYTLPATSYTWMPGSLNGTTQTVAPGTSTPYTVTFVDSATGCTNIATLPIIVVPPSYVTATTSATAICVGDSVNLLAADSVPIISYCPASASCDEAVNNVVFNTISNATGCSGGYSDQTAISTMVSAGTTYPINVTTTNYYSSDQCSVWMDWNQDGDFTDPGEALILSGGPTFSGSIAVPLTALNGSTRMRIRMTYTGVNAPCGTQTWGETEDYTVVINGGVPAPPTPSYTYNWMPGGLMGAAQTITPSANTTYIVTQTDSASGCTAVDSVTINVGATPTLAVTANPSATVCVGDTVTLMSGATGFDNLTWNGNATIGTDTILTPATTGNYTVVATNTTSGCSATDYVMVMVNTPLSFDSIVASATTVCATDDVILRAYPGELAAYCVSIAGSTADSKIDTVSFAGVTTSSPAVNEDYTDNTSVIIPVTAGSTYPLSVANGDISSPFYGPNELYVYIDYNQNYSFEPSELVYQTSATASMPNSLASTNITIPLTALNGPTRMRVILHEELVFTEQPCGTYSWGETEDYTVNITGGTTPPPATSGFASIAWSPATSPSTGDSVSAQNLTANTTYIATGTDANGCVSTSSVSITVNPKPTVVANASATAVCPNDSVTLTGSGTAVVYDWNNGVFDGVAFPVPTTTAYVVTGTAFNGCTAKDTILITTNPTPALTVIVDSNETCPGTMNGAATAVSPGMLVPIYSEDFESAVSLTRQTDTSIIPGLTNWSYSTSVQGEGRLRTTAGGAFYHGGSRAATLDRDPSGSNVINYLEAQVDLSSYTTSDLTLSFWFMHHGEESNSNDRVWVRGSSVDPWVLAYDWYANRPATGSWGQAIVNLDSILTAASQVVSSTSGIRFGQEDNFPATSTTASDGVTFDDILILAPSIDNILWSTSDTTNSIAGLGSGVYTVTAANSFGCTSTDSATITIINPAPNVTATPSTATSCYGDSITIVGSGASTYTITGGAMNNTPFVPTSSQYIVTGVDTNGCTDTAAVNVILAGSTIFTEDFSDNSAGWILDTEWEIDSAQVSSCSNTTSLFEDPALDHSPTADNGVAGVVIGGCATTTLHSAYYLTSPIINTAGVLDSLELSFYRWLNSDYTPYMQNFVEIYDGSAWVVLWQSGGSPTIADNSWNLQTYDITAYKNDSMRIRFGHLVGNAGAYNAPSWNIDDITISSASTPKLSNATAGNAASTPGTGAGSKTQNTSTATLYYDNSCDLITRISNNASSLGNVVANVTVASTVPTHNGQPYVARYYEISPTNNVAADVIFYFTQDDFDDYNAYATANGWPLLPVNPTDFSGMNRIRITKNDNGGLGVNPVVLIPSAVLWNFGENRWEVWANVPSFSQFRIHAVNPGNTALAVEYKDFTVTKQATSDLVEWTTVMENNSSHFNVQRSLDGNTFETLGTVQSKAVNGVSSRELNYTFVDETPQIGHNYYRLEQVDIDNRTSYTKSIDIIWGATGSVVSIYPNPTKDFINIDLTTDKVSQTEIKLLDMSGRVVKSVIAKTQKGLNNIKLDMSEVSNGVYGVQIYENNKLTHVSKVRKND